MHGYTEHYKAFKFYLSVASLLNQKLFSSGCISFPVVKLNGVTIISKFKRDPIVRNRTPET